jgi:ribosomal protein L11 methyltransferase
MKWLEIRVEADAEASEAVAEVLSRFAPEGVAIELPGAAEDATQGPMAVKAYLAVGPDTSRVQDQVSQALWHLGQIYPVPAPTFSLVAESDWANAWKEHFYPLRVGQRIVIKPTWREFETNPGDILIELDPGMAFGTGLHPTTQMCLMALEQELQPGMQVLDLGTGSGVLALAAAKLGAQAVLALDTDPVAVAAARENVRRNGVSETVTVTQGSLAQVAGTYDLVVVNILAKVILALAQEGLAECVRPGGRWVTAGTIEPQVAQVATALETTGLCVTERRQIADWVTLIGSRLSQQDVHE